MPNELSAIAKFIYGSLVNDSYWNTNYTAKGSNFFAEAVPIGTKILTPAAMFIEVNTDDNRGAFGIRLCSSGVYEIKAVIQGQDFSLIADAADQIDRIFDWQNQNDVTAGRPKSSEVFTDPDTSIEYVIMCLVRNKPIKYPTFDEGVLYAHLGGEYYIQYYQNT